MTLPVSITYALECQACATCRFWREELNDAFGRIGTCRFHAPRPLTTEHDWDPQAYWPTTHADDWCGQWCPGGNP